MLILRRKSEENRTTRRKILGAESKIGTNAPTRLLLIQSTLVVACVASVSSGREANSFFRPRENRTSAKKKKKKLEGEGRRGPIFHAARTLTISHGNACYAGYIGGGKFSYFKANPAPFKTQTRGIISWLPCQELTPLRPTRPLESSRDGKRCKFNEQDTIALRALKHAKQQSEITNNTVDGVN